MSLVEHELVLYSTSAGEIARDYQLDPITKLG